jgi:hypothetical protein
MDDHGAVMRARTKLTAVLGACALALLAATLLPSRRQARSERPATPATAAPDSAPLPPRKPASTSSAIALANTAAPDPHRHPHPITAEHRRLYREADLLDGAAASLRKNDVAQARALLAQHGTEYEARSDSEGLALLADCIEHRDTASLERARGFYDRNIHSMVRRQLRTQCLESASQPRAARIEAKASDR